jgi:hypothetical protein
LNSQLLPPFFVLLWMTLTADVTGAHPSMKMPQLPPHCSLLPRRSFYERKRVCKMYVNYPGKCSNARTVTWSCLPVAPLAIITLDAQRSRTPSSRVASLLAALAIPVLLRRPNPLNFCKWLQYCLLANQILPHPSLLSNGLHVSAKKSQSFSLT